MWVCKKCGGKYFTELYKGGYKKYDEYDRNGDPIENSLVDDDPELYTECDECGNFGLKLKNVAEWKEEEN